VLFVLALMLNDMLYSMVDPRVVPQLGPGANQS